MSWFKLMITLLLLSKVNLKPVSWWYDDSEPGDVEDLTFQIPYQPSQPQSKTKLIWTFSRRPKGLFCTLLHMVPLSYEGLRLGMYMDRKNLSFKMRWDIKSFK